MNALGPQKENSVNLAVNYVCQKMQQEEEFQQNEFFHLQKMLNMENEGIQGLEQTHGSKIKSKINQIETAKQEIKQYLNLSNPNLIGIGCQSYVFSCVDFEMNRYAVKCFNIFQDKNDEIDIEQLKRAEFEAKVLSENQNENVVYCFQKVRGNQFYLIQLEQCVGTLSELKEQIGILSQKQFIQYLIDIMKGLHFTQQNKMINRDLKPDNILIGFDGRLKLSDFGLSFQLKSFSIKYAPSIQGNCYHFAPELIEENLKKMINSQQSFESKQSMKTDCFAAGLILMNLISKNSEYQYFRLLHDEDYVNKMEFNMIDHFKHKKQISEILRSLLAYYPQKRADPQQVLQQINELMNSNPQDSVLRSNFYFNPLKETEYKEIKQIKCGNFIPVDKSCYFFLPYNYIYQLAQKKYQQLQIKQATQNLQANSAEKEFQSKIQSQMNNFEQQISLIKSQMVSQLQMNSFVQQINLNVQNLTNQCGQNVLKIQQMEQNVASQIQQTNNFINSVDKKLQEQINQAFSNSVNKQTHNNDLKQIKEELHQISQQLSDNLKYVNSEVYELKQNCSQQYQLMIDLQQTIQNNNLQNFNQQQYDWNNNNNQMQNNYNINQHNQSPIQNQNICNMQNGNIQNGYEKVETNIQINQQSLNQIPNDQQNNNFFTNTFNQNQNTYNNQNLYKQFNLILQHEQQNNQEQLPINQIDSNQQIQIQNKHFNLTNQNGQQNVQNQFQNNYQQPQNAFNITYEQQQFQYNSNQNNYQKPQNNNQNLYLTQQYDKQIQQDNDGSNHQQLKNQNKQFNLTLQHQNLNQNIQEPLLVNQFDSNQQIQNNQNNNVQQNYLGQTVYSNQQQNQEQINPQQKQIIITNQGQSQFQDKQNTNQANNNNNNIQLFKNNSYSFNDQQLKQDKQQSLQLQSFNSQPDQFKEIDLQQQLTDITSQMKKLFSSFVDKQTLSLISEESIKQSYFIKKQIEKYVFVQGLQFPNQIKTPQEKEDYLTETSKTDNWPSNFCMIKIIKFSDKYFIQYGQWKNYEKKDMEIYRFKQFKVLFDQLLKLQQYLS